MQNTPEAGKTYISSADPSLIIYVEAVHTLDKDDPDYLEGFFTVEGCDPANIDDMQALGYDFDSTTWLEHGFSPLCA